MDGADIYATTRGRLLALAGDLSDDQIATPVAATPPWTVKDAYGHLVGASADILAGRMPGEAEPSDAWTARQVAERADRSLADVCGEWAETGPKLDDWMRERGDRAMFAAFDVWTHEQDIRSAVGEPCERDAPRVHALADRAAHVMTRVFGKADAPALRVAHDGGERVIGEGEPEATLRVDDYEALRIIFGRRSRRQVERADWEGPIEPYLDHLQIFDFPVSDLDD